jgi:uncharacterized protein with PIN domain
MNFVVDRTLGKLAKWLRILGYDTLYWRTDDLAGILRQAREEDRTLITKETRLYQEKGTVRALLIRESNPFLQLRTVVRQFRLPLHKEQLFSRCLICNAPLEDVLPEEVKEEVPEYIYHSHQEFSRCPLCRKVYWAGSHYGHMVEVVDRLEKETT